ncbi:MAG: hypothetical protein PHQ98_01090 [Candidatus ainarchaeum sp.]|nr:hypothetical protein [Candidatus ainarchaeum sp.]
MAKAENNFIVLNKTELNLFKQMQEFEIVPNGEGIFLLIDKKIANSDNLSNKVCFEKPQLVDEKQVIIDKIRNQENLSELVEGKFEKTLNEQERKALLDLLVTQKVIVFKLNENYKKGIYKINEKQVREKKESENFLAEKKMPVEYTIEKDGFISTTNLERAKILSSDYKEEIQEGKLKGIKSFEGIYYLVQTELLQDYKKKIILSFQENKHQNIDEIAIKLNVSKELVKLTCEFLKEDGELLERKKEQYTYIN